jgi:hypothetical protein
MLSSPGMLPAAFRRGKAPAAVAVLGLLSTLAVLQRDTPLFVNLGPGDELLARGFRSGWERDGLAGSGETMFRWTEDGARLELPVVVLGGRPRARLRLARFAEDDAALSVVVNGVVVERWVQSPRGFGLRSFDLGAVLGPLRMQFRSEATGDDPLGVALDWIEIEGAAPILPRAERWPGLLLLFVGVPLLLFVLAGRGAALAAAVMLAVAGPLAVALDRLGGLWLLSQTGLSSLLLVVGLAVIARALHLAWPVAAPLPARLALPVLLALAPLLALSHPFFHYPDIDVHARFVEALVREPALALDPTPFQRTMGAWTRTIAGARVLFPYSPVFHIAAAPLSLVLGTVPAIKLLAALSLGTTLLLVRALASGAGLGAPWGALAQCLVAVLPVTSSRLTLALFPTLMGQALELLLAAQLALGLLSSRAARPGWATLILLLAAQLGYTGSLFNVALLVLALVGAELLRGERRAAFSLLALYALTAAVVVAGLYGRFLPSLLRDVLPHAASAAGDADALAPQEPWRAMTQRLYVFYGMLLPSLAAAGLVATRSALEPVWRLVRLLLLSGLTLGLLRVLAPAVFRDAKEIELLAAPLGLLAVAGLRALAGLRFGRPLSALLAMALLTWGVARAVAVYAERFFTVGR